jgi:4,5-dihydroxyphthalate decarboxylase
VQKSNSIEQQVPNPKLHFYFREPTVDTNMPITDGTIKVEGFDVEIVAREEEADAWDCGFAARVRAYSKGAPHLSIPAFPNRKFRLSYIFVNGSSGIEKPKDLEGKRVGIMQWDNTAGVWARGALQHHYDVDLRRICWQAVQAKQDSVPPGIHIEKVTGDGDADAILDELLVEAKLDAVIGPNVLASISRKDSRVRRLFRDYKAEEQNYFRETGIFPISHVVTLKQGFIERHPNAPVALLKAFRLARDEAFNRLEGPDPQVLVVSWIAAAVEEQRALMGEHYWPYNIHDNRTALEAVTQFAYEQGLSSEKVAYELLFHPEAAELSGT